MLQLHFDNRFLSELPGDPETGPRPRQVHGALWSRVSPAPVPAPLLLAHSREMARRLGISESDVQSPGFAQVFSGNQQLPGMDPFASNYGGHQFGTWSGQLGDGRAIGLGELVNADGERWELQLKGAGPTPYSRGADGRAVLRSSIREFLCSEAMHHLGVPTTRALCLVATGEPVERDMFYDGHARLEPGAIVCRAAPSFLRFGHFELPAARGDHALLRRLADFAIDRDFPELAGSAAYRYGDWFASICERTATLVAEWMRVGFVHGVMNTDNLSILGLTIDYGPYGWIDDYDPDWTPNTTDAHGRRYRFGWQPRIAHWNLVRLAQALAPLFGDVEPLQAGLNRYGSRFDECWRDIVARKLGLAEFRQGDDALMAGLQTLMHRTEVDMTLAFRALADIEPDRPDPVPLHDAFYDEAKRDRQAPGVHDWLQRYGARLHGDPLPAQARRRRMNAANPRFVLRNYLAQDAIDRAEAGDIGGVTELLEVMRRPYDEQPDRQDYARRRPDAARDQPGCSMLSCSS